MLAKSLSLPTRPLWHTPAEKTRACAPVGVAGHNREASSAKMGRWVQPRRARAGRLCTRMRTLLYEGGNVLDVPAGTDAETKILAWLMGALERAREEGHERLAGYLEAVADDAVFEAEAATRRAGG